MRNLLIGIVLRVAAAWGMLDSECVLAESQAPTVVGDTPSTNVYAAMNSVTGDMGQTGEHIWIKAHCSTVPTSGGNATIQAVLQNSSDNATWVDVVAGPALLYSAITLGQTMLAVQPPPGMLQYFRVVWRIAVAALTGGTFDAYVSESIQRNVAQPSGFTVD